MKRQGLILFSAFALLALSACNQADRKELSAPVSAENNTTPVQGDVLTAEERARLTPEMILQQFKEGNERFRTNHTTQRNHSEQIRKAAVGQFPKAVVLSCVDSRVPVEDVFDQGLGDVFVARVAGNIMNEDILGSLEFACKVAGAKLILVMGHQHCGAIKGAIDKVNLGNLTSLLKKIEPAIRLSDKFEGEKRSSNDDYVRMVAQNNVRETIREIRERSPLLKEMEEKGEIRIVGAFYTLTRGELVILD